MVWPSNHPSSRRPWRTATTEDAGPGSKDADRGPKPELRIPTTGTFPACWGSATSGAASMLPPITVMNARRSISVCSLDDLVGPDEDGLRDRESKSLGGFEVDEQLELGGLLDGKVGRFGSFENLIDEVRGAATDF